MSTPLHASGSLEIVWDEPQWPRYTADLYLATSGHPAVTKDVFNQGKNKE